MGILGSFPLRRAGRAAGRIALLVGLTLPAWVFGAAGADEPEKPPEPLRIGIYHPRPRLCDGREPAQRDLRVLKLAFALGLRPQDRLRLPWYLAAVQAGMDPPERLRLRTESLWDLPWIWLRRFPPDFREPTAFDPLFSWRAAVQRALAGGRPVGPPAAAWANGGSSHGVDGSAHSDLWFPLPPDDPYARVLIWSRLQGSGLLPRMDGMAASDLGPDCPGWPAGVWLMKRDDVRTYQMTVLRDAPGTPFTLAGYREYAPLWRDLRRGRLDALLLEGEDVEALADRMAADPEMIWGREIGTQQVALMPSSALYEVLGAARLRALSLATHRAGLASVFPAGAYRAARGPLLQVNGSGSGNVAPGLRWNPREARRIWLAQPHSGPRMRLVTLDHPALVAIARRLSEQWQKTLNLTVDWVALSIEEFETARRVGGHDLFLVVTDLDDGSLQDLWIEALHRAEPEGVARTPGITMKPAVPPSWEEWLLKAWPYLPLLEKVQLSVARGARGVAAIRRICPACEVPVADPPVRSRRRAAPQPAVPIPEEG